MGREDKVNDLKLQQKSVTLFVLQSSRLLPIVCICLKNQFVQSCLLVFQGTSAIKISHTGFLTQFRF